MAHAEARRQVLTGMDLDEITAGLRADFPLWDETSDARNLVFLDSAASAQKPRTVIQAMQDFYATGYANIHRGVYGLSQDATRLYEQARGKVQRLLGAARPEEIVFVRGATEGVNLVAWSFARPRLSPGDEVVVSEMEHHSNIVPWQLVCQATGARLKVAPMNDRGELDLEALAGLLGERTRVLAVGHVSNALGTVNPVKEIIRLARRFDVAVVVDGAQAVPHLTVDVQDLDCDFYVFSGHKLYGPTGVGAVYGKHAHLLAMPPWQGGGDMIRSVTFAETTYAEPPARFEAGTPHIAGAIGLGVAIDYVTGVGYEHIAAHEQDLLAYGTRVLGDVPGLRLIGTAEQKVGVFSFVLDGVHPHDVGTFLDQEHIAVRTGHHCAQPVMDHFQVPATTRASLGLYNTRHDLDALAAALVKIQEFFGV